MTATTVPLHLAPIVSCARRCKETLVAKFSPPMIDLPSVVGFERGGQTISIAVARQPEAPDVLAGMARAGVVGYEPDAVMTVTDTFNAKHGDGGEVVITGESLLVQRVPRHGAATALHFDYRVAGKVVEWADLRECGCSHGSTVDVVRAAYDIEPLRADLDELLGRLEDERDARAALDRATSIHLVQVATVLERGERGLN